MSTLRTTEPSLRSRWLGRHLRALREDHGFTLRHVERMAGVTYGAVKAVEQGVHQIQVSQVHALLELYGVTDKEERDLLLDLARDVRYLHRWESRADVPPLSAAALDYLWLESHARHIRSYSATLVPDLLQLPEYAEAVAEQSNGPAAWWEWACIERQRVLDCPPHTLHAVMAEAALHRPPGRSPLALRRQLHHLAEVTNVPNVTVQVLPTTVPYLPGMDGSFAALELVPPYGPAAAVHDLTDPVIHERRRAEQFADVFEQLSKAALDEAASADLIAKAAERSSNREE